jgi:2'-5' RNA ligase
MSSVFTALWPPREAIDDLGAAIDRLRAQPDLVSEASVSLRGFRFIPPERWHVTLCFHGETDFAEQDRLSARLDRRVPKLAAAPRLRLTGAGVFRGVLWVGVEPDQDDDVALRALVRAAGADPNGFHGHLTVARWARGSPDRAVLRALLADYAGPRWTADSVALVRSELEKGARKYRTVHTVECPAPRSGRQDS